MKVWIFVEGESDRLALQALWKSCGWQSRLQVAGWGIQPIALGSKIALLQGIGLRAAAKLKDHSNDLVLCMPDLFPTEQLNSEFRHSDFQGLVELQNRLVRKAFQEKSLGSQNFDRFYAGAFKYDLEVLLLAAETRLRAHLRCPTKLGDWRFPPEDQNGNKPPKYVVEEIFRSRSPNRQSYRDTIHAPAVLRNVQSLRELLYDERNMVKLPVFKNAIDWISEKTGVNAY